MVGLVGNGLKMFDNKMITQHLLIFPCRFKWPFVNVTLEIIWSKNINYHRV